MPSNDSNQPFSFYNQGTTNNVTVYLLADGFVSLGNQVQLIDGLPPYNTIDLSTATNGLIKSISYVLVDWPVIPPHNEVTGGGFNIETVEVVGGIEDGYMIIDVKTVQGSGCEIVLNDYGFYYGRIPTTNDVINQIQITVISP